MSSEAEDTKNVLKNREQLYRLIISQLFYDGHQNLAVSLSSLIQADPPCPPSDRLHHVVLAGLTHEPDIQRPLTKAELMLGPGLDLEYETDVQSLAPEPALYETAYVTSHKGNCRAGAFSADGQLPGSDQQGHPVIRTLYDHLEEVTCLEFHPREPILASGSRDFTVKLFDYSKASDSDRIRCMGFHPTGDYMVVGSNHPVLRVYDVATAQFSPDSKLYASGSKDGSIKLWDGVSSRCVNTFRNAHDGAEVCSVTFSRNGKYLLSSGMDSLIKLWELSTSRCLIAYTGAGTTGKQEHRAQASFNHTEDYVMFPDEATTSLCCWNSRNASRKTLLSLGHNGAVRYLVHSPNSPAFLTCSDDFRARFWYRRMPTH
ncbi:hypothetical protein B566_EDAN008214 [Ephemera danica]|nr:hypothetical protein B566_EDAN008214 [Ephemera danica]